MVTYKAIAAMAENRVIGCQNKIPWHLPEELQWFRQKTLSQRILMGRKTFESIGHVLLNRTTYVLSRSNIKVPKEVILIHDAKALDDLEGDVWICGGAHVYEQFLPKCSELFLTLVHQAVEGNAFFPEIPKNFTLKALVKETSMFTIQQWIQM